MLKQLLLWSLQIGSYRDRRSVPLLGSRLPLFHIGAELEQEKDPRTCLVSSCLSLLSGGLCLAHLVLWSMDWARLPALWRLARVSWAALGERCPIGASGLEESTTRRKPGPVFMLPKPTQHQSPCWKDVGVNSQRWHRKQTVTSSVSLWMESAPGTEARANLPCDFADWIKSSAACAFGLVSIQLFHSLQLLSFWGNFVGLWLIVFRLFALGLVPVFRSLG